MALVAEASLKPPKIHFKEKSYISSKRQIVKTQYLKPFASITVDCVIFGYNEKRLDVLLIKRDSEPEAGKWALPGGFMEKNETTDESAQRVLKKMTGVSNSFMEQFYVFSEHKRNPMGRVVTIGYYALVDPSLYELKPSWHASDAKWFDTNKLPKLAFDHSDIVNKALLTLKKEVKLKPIGFELLPKKFTLSELQNLYEVVVGKTLDRRNFRKKLKAMDILKELNEVKEGAHRPAKLFKFEKKQYNAYLKNNEFHFDF